MKVKKAVSGGGPAPGCNGSCAAVEQQASKSEEEMELTSSEKELKLPSPSMKQFARGSVRPTPPVILACVHLGTPRLMMVLCSSLLFAVQP